MSDSSVQAAAAAVLFGVLDRKWDATVHELAEALDKAGLLTRNTRGDDG